MLLCRLAKTAGSQAPGERFARLGFPYLWANARGRSFSEDAESELPMALQTPWGMADCVVTLGEVTENGCSYAILSVSTPSHGGIYVPPALLHHIPEHHRAYAKKWSRSESWYEEDCAWAAVALAFPQLFPAAAVQQAACVAAQYLNREGLDWNPTLQE
jgi:hypothetical protein